MAISDDIADGFIKQDVDVMRIEANMRRDIRKMLNGLSREAIGKILNINPTSATFEAAKKRRMALLFADVRELANRAYNQISNEVQKELGAMARAEANLVLNTTNAALQIELLTNVPDLKVMTELARNTLVQGAVNRNWWSQQSKAFINRFQREMREGILLNEDINSLSRRIRGTRAAGFRNGIMNTTKREADALVRTAVQSVAQNARNKMYDENSDVIKGKQWLATLDSRTSDTCIALDGQAWTLSGEKLPGTTLAWNGPPPAHWNCRSTLIPIVKEFSDMVKDPKLKRKLRSIEKEQKGNKEKLSRLDGTIAQKTTYNKWLKKQSKETQIEILGPTKRRLWKSGKLKHTDLIDQSHRPLTVKELMSKFDVKDDSL